MKPSYMRLTSPLRPPFCYEVFSNRYPTNCLEVMAETAEKWAPIFNAPITVQVYMSGQWIPAITVIPN